MIIGGPTGSGKTQAALELNSRYPVEIVNADSRQIYSGLSIGTNQPSAEELAAVPHHLFGFIEPTREFSMADYERLAFAAVQDIGLRNKLPVVAGGTGFYIRALLKGVWRVPPKDPVLRKRLRNIANRKSSQFLHRMLEKFDPLTAAKTSANDTYRIVRSLEIYFQSGKRKSDISADHPDRFSAIKLFLNPDKEKLESLIKTRTVRMFDQGWPDEVRKLLQQYPDFESMPAAKSLGYREVISYLKGEMTEADCKALIVRKTLQYAKRQRTWFRNQDGFIPLQSLEELQIKLDSVLQ